MTIWRVTISAAVLLSGSTGLAQEDLGGTTPTPRFSVVTGKGRGAPNLKRPVAKYVERKLKVFGDAVSQKEYQRVAKQKRIKKRDLPTVASGRIIGPELGLTHVVLIESVKERESVPGRRKKKNVFYAEVTVLAVASGDVVFTNRFKLAGRRLNLAIGTDITSAVGENLKPPPPPEPAADAPSPPPPPPPDPTDPVADAPPPPEPPGDPILPDEEPIEITEAPPPEPPPGPASSSMEIFGTTDSGADPAPRRRRRKSRPGFEFLVGPSTYERDGRVTGNNVPEDVNYDGPMPGANLELALYPLAFGGEGEFIEGLGIKARGNYSLVTTQFDPTDPDATVDSDVFSYEGGLALRMPFGDELDDVDLTVVVGYAYWQFPLSEGSFPGAKYDGIYAQLGVTVPFIEEFAFFIDGGMIPALNTDGRLKRLGEQDSGFAFNGNVGFKFWFDPFDIRLQGHYRSYSASFTGTSSLGLRTELENPEISDTYFGGSLLIGVSL
ncbi:MAG: hypothetical protein AAF654_03310 [Myxococcota bacterium]